MAFPVRKSSTNYLNEICLRPESSGNSSSASLVFPDISSNNDFHPPSIKLPNTLFGSSRSSSYTSIETNTEEYGHYDDVFFDNPPSSRIVTGIISSDIGMKKPSCSSKSSTPPPSSSGVTTASSSLLSTPLSQPGSKPVTPTRIKDSQKQKQQSISCKEKSVVCLIEDQQCSLTCRSFESTDETSCSSPKVTVSVSMGGIRVILENDTLVEIPEYKVKIKIEEEEYIVWKRFSDFQSLGEACRYFTFHNKKSLLIKTVKSWKAVLSHRPFWIKPNSVNFLIEESKLLEMFMENLLFEIPCIEMLFEFLLSS
jgi:hypothetical protein